MFLQLEQECLDIYRRKVERSRKYRAELQQSLADYEAEIAQLASALGELVSLPQVCSQLFLCCYSVHFNNPYDFYFVSLPHNVVQISVGVGF